MSKLEILHLKFSVTERNTANQHYVKPSAKNTMDLTWSIRETYKSALSYSYKNRMH